MTRKATRITNGLAAAGLATVLWTAPASASDLPDPEWGCDGTACGYGTSTPAPSTSGAGAPSWLKIVLGAAGGVAVAGAGAATVSSRKHHHQQPQRKDLTAAH